MPYILQNTTDLELNDENGDTITINEFTENVEHKLVSKALHSTDKDEWEAEFTAKHGKDTIILHVNYSSGEDGLNTGDVEVDFDTLPEGYELESLPNFEFQEDDDLS